MEKANAAASIDAYLATFDGKVREVLEEVRARIAKAAPGATEKISYGMPTFHLGENVVHFAAMKNHLGFYPTPAGITAFAKELAPYVTSKGAVQFPWGEKVPYALIEKITRYRVKAAKERAAAKAAPKKQAAPKAKAKAAPKAKATRPKR